MGPGIFTKYSKQVIGGILAIFILFGATVLIYKFRSPIGRESPHETVNDLYEWEYMTFRTENSVYPADVETIRLYFRNDAPGGVVCLSAVGNSFAYELEYLKDGKWRQVHPQVKYPRWSGKTDIVNWAGGEAELSCNIGRDYKSPLKTGQYRIVLPECEHFSQIRSALTVEFEVK